MLTLPGHSISFCNGTQNNVPEHFLKSSDAAGRVLPAALKQERLNEFQICGV